MSWLDVLAVAALGLAVCLGAGVAGSVVCWWKEAHRYAAWYDYNIRFDARNCVRCGDRQYRENEWWIRVNAPASDPAPANTSPIAIPVNVRSAQCGTGTSEIPRVSIGESPFTPIRPRVPAVGRHAAAVPELT